MDQEDKDNLHLEIGHVLFIDIVGYSRLLIEEQKERLNQLTAIVLATGPRFFVRSGLLYAGRSLAARGNFTRLPAYLGGVSIERHRPGVVPLTLMPSPQTE